MLKSKIFLSLVGALMLAAFSACSSKMGELSSILLLHALKAAGEVFQ